jgi:inorganic pyrophosphatase
MAEVERSVPVIAEIPKGSRNKYEFDHRTDRVRLGRSGTPDGPPWMSPQPATSAAG